MATFPAPDAQRPAHLLIILAVGLGAAVLSSSSALSAGLVAQLDHWMYLPYMAKPVPTPTLTPTATPLPPKVDVRVEGEDTCSRFRGGSRQDPNGEYVCFRNYDVQLADMTGWRVEDASSHSYTFPPFTLNTGATVRLRSGPGTDTLTDLHWGRGLVWNNDHDTVYLYDAFGRLVSRHVY